MSSGFAPEYNICDSQRISLRGRGTTSVWDSGTSGTSSDLPPVLMLHGWNVDAPTNFGYLFPLLAESHRVVMFDHHGHGKGVRTTKPFTLGSAATDAVGVLDALEIESAIVVGYSLGGAIAQTLVANHPVRCSGLVLSATAGRFAESRLEATQFRAMASLARILRGVPKAARARVLSATLAVATLRYPNWIAEVVGQANMITLLEAGASLGKFNTSDAILPAPIPSAFVVTTQDRIVKMERQVRLATELGVTALHRVEADHAVPILNDDEYHTALIDAVHAVTNAALRRQ